MDKKKPILQPLLIQEGLEAFQDIRANDAESKYLQELWTRVGLVASRLYDPMSGSLINLGAVVSLGVQSERMDEILNHADQRGEESLSNKGYDIEFKDVCFAYDSSETVLDGVSFTAKQGEVTALIGRKDASDAEVIAAARLAHVDVFAEKLPQGWNTMIGENGSELSGGERQRISIAHRMRTVAGADKIVVLKEGKVEEWGTPAALAASGGFYKRMRDIQQGALEWKL